VKVSVGAVKGDQSRVFRFKLSNLTVVGTLVGKIDGLVVGAVGMTVGIAVGAVGAMVGVVEGNCLRECTPKSGICAEA
jgi:uncharacterized membrane protein